MAAFLAGLAGDDSDGSVDQGDDDQGTIHPVPPIAEVALFTVHQP